MSNKEFSTKTSTMHPQNQNQNQKPKTPLTQAMSNLFYFSASICLNCGLGETEVILKNMMDRLKADQLELSDLSPQVRKTFEFYCQNQPLFA